MSGPGSDFAAQQLVELLSVVSSCQTEDSATQAAVERAAQTLEAEAAALIVDDRVVTSVGFPAGSHEQDVLAGVAPGRHVQLDVPGVGKCAAGAARLGERDEGRLVIARCDVDFSVAEYNLIRGMARVLGLTLRMLRTLDAERRRQRMMQHLYGVQRAITRRGPLADILDMIVNGVCDMVGAADGFVELWLIDAQAGGLLTLAARAGTAHRAATWPGRLPLTDADPIGRAMLTERIVGAGVDGTDDAFVPGQPGVRCLVAPVYESGQVAGSLLVSRGHERPFMAADQEKLLSFAEHVSLAITDARTLREKNEAMHDSLTGLASRALFLDRVTNELAHTERGEALTALLFIDLDRFKEVNDKFGHSGGDALLIGVAERIGAAIRAGDAASRFGGDEFAVMLRNIASETQAADVATRIIGAIGLPFAVPGGTADVDASVGIAFSRYGQHDAEELLHQADLAMYQAKRDGRGRWVVYDETLDRQLGAARDGGGPARTAGPPTRRLLYQSARGGRR